MCLCECVCVGVNLYTYTEDKINGIHRNLQYKNGLVATQV